MSTSRWLARAVSLLQLVVVLPPMVSGSVCISANGSAEAELGFCACEAPFPGMTETAFAVPRTPECGPCRDEAFSALRVARAAAIQAPLLESPFAASDLIALASPVPEPPAWYLRDHPGNRLPILRC